MVPAKCPNCGANIVVDETKDAGICTYCGTPFVTEKAISVTNNTTTNKAQTIINNYYTTPAQTPTAPPAYNSNPPVVPTEPRPKVRILLAIVLFYLYVIPGIIYVSWVRGKQKEWDRKYRGY